MALPVPRPAGISGLLVALAVGIVSAGSLMLPVMWVPQAWALLRTLSA